jgi:hypothetical protein
VLKGGLAYNLSDGLTAGGSVVEAGFKNKHINGSVTLGNASLNAYYGKEKIVGATASVVKFDVKKSFSIKGLQVELGANFSIASIGREYRWSKNGGGFFIGTGPYGGGIYLEIK